MDLLLRRGELVLADGIRSADLLIRGEKISRIAPVIEPGSPGDRVRIIDCAGRLVLPGFVDAHTHFGLGQGKNRTADGFFEGGLAAAVGGVTTCIDFSDQPPGLTLLAGAEKRIAEAGDACIDFALHQGVYRWHAGIAGELDELAAAGVTALKIFSTYKKAGVFLDPSAWPGLFPLCRERRFLVTMHAEDDQIIEEIERNLRAVPGRAVVDGPERHGLLRPARAEASTVRKAGLCALQHGLPLYFVHLSSAAGLGAVRELRGLGLPVVAETTPHYLLLGEERLEGEDGALFLMTPPLRSSADRRALSEALFSGEIEVLATDHCAFTKEVKMRSADCRSIPAGIPGTGEAAVLLFSLLPGDAAAKAIALSRIFSGNPARIFGLYPRKGSLEPGTDADVVVFDPRASGLISKSSIKTAAGYSPYEGFRFEGAPVMTILRGKVIAEGGDFTGKRGTGRFVRCGESSVYGGAT